MCGLELSGWLRVGEMVYTINKYIEDLPKEVRERAHTRLRFLLGS